MNEMDEWEEMDGTKINTEALHAPVNIHRSPNYLTPPICINTPLENFIQIEKYADPSAENYREVVKAAFLSISAILGQFWSF